MPTEFATGNRRLFSKGFSTREANPKASENFGNNHLHSSDAYAQNHQSTSFLDHLSGQNFNLLCQGAASFLRELGWEQLAFILENGKGEINLALGTKAKVEIAEKQYDAQDKHILQDEIRKDVNAKFQRNKQEIAWMETKGTVEFQGSNSQKVGLKNATKGFSETQLLSLMKYRKLEPFDEIGGALERGFVSSRSFKIPINANMASQMLAGSEFEIACEGHALLKPEASSSFDIYKSGPLKLSMDGSIGLLNDLEGNTSILVQKLTKPNLVMVKISSTSGLTTSLYSRISTKLYANIKMPSGLQKFLEKVSKIFNWVGLLAWFYSFFNHHVSAGVQNNAKNTNKAVKQYVFDLSFSQAQAAYNDIFLKFSTQTADLLTNKPDTGVRLQGGAEKESITNVLYDARVGITEIGVLQNINKEREGKLSSGVKDDILFKEKGFYKKYFNWFAGKKKISWESVILYDEISKENQCYYHLIFNNDDRIVKKEEIQEFLNFAKSLGVKIKSLGMKDSTVVDLLEVLADRDDTLTSVDIYFTDAGIKKINTAKPFELLKAFLIANKKMDSSLEKMPFLKKNSKSKLILDQNSKSFKLVKKYEQLINKSFLIRWWFRGEIRCLEEQYDSLYARNIRNDAKAVHEASLFAKQIKLLNENDKKSQVKKFFAHLGHSKGFNYAKTIAAMAYLAGEKETIIHDLSLSAGGLSLRHRDEGEIIHPEHEVMRALASLA